MKLTIAPWQNFSGYLYVKAFAVIDVQDGAVRRYQRTWKVRTVAPRLAGGEMEKAFKAEATRWAAKILTGATHEKTKTVHH